MPAADNRADVLTMHIEPGRSGFTMRTLSLGKLSKGEHDTLQSIEADKAQRLFRARRRAVIRQAGAWGPFDTLRPFEHSHRGLCGESAGQR